MDTAHSAHADSGYWHRSNWIRDLPVSQFNGTLKVVLYALNNFSGKSVHAWPSVRALSQATGLSTRTVQASIKRLSDPDGLAVLEIRPFAGPRGCSVYVLKCDRLKTFATTRVTPELNFDLDELIEAVPDEQSPLTVADSVTMPVSSDKIERTKPTKTRVSAAGQPPHQIVRPVTQIASCGPTNQSPSVPITQPIETPIATPQCAVRSVKPAVLPPAPQSTRPDRKPVTSTGCHGQMTDTEVLRILREKDVAAFEALDDRGCQMFGWSRGEAFRRNRLCLWFASVRYATEHGGSCAALAKKAIRYEHFHLMNDQDRTAAVNFLRVNRSPVLAMSPIRTPQAGLTASDAVAA